MRVVVLAPAGAPDGDDQAGSDHVHEQGAMRGVESDGDRVVGVAAGGNDIVTAVGGRGGPIGVREGYEDAVDVEEQVGRAHRFSQGIRGWGSELAGGVGAGATGRAHSALVLHHR